MISTHEDKITLENNLIKLLTGWEDYKQKIF